MVERITEAKVAAAMEAWFAQPSREDDMSLERSIRAMLAAAATSPRESLPCAWLLTNRKSGHKILRFTEPADTAKNRADWGWSPLYHG